MKTCGIYAFVNRTTGQMYVAQSIDIARRFARHIYLLRNGASPCRELQAAFDLEGESAFDRRVVEECPADLLDAREQSHLDAGFAAGLLYNNATRAGWPPAGHEHSAEARAAGGARRRAHLATPEGKAKLIKGLATRSAAWREKTARRGREWRSNPEFVARHNEAIRRRSENPEWKLSIAERNKKMATDPAWRLAVAAGQRTDAARASHGAATKRSWAERRKDPVAYAAWCSKISAGKRAGALARGKVV